MAALAVKDAIRTRPGAGTPISNIELKTYDDLLAMPDDGNRYELIFGEIVMSAAPKTTHQDVLSELNDRFKRHVIKHQLGKVYFAPVDVKFSIYNVVEPDLLFVKRERLGIVLDDSIDGAPDVIVEVLSPSNRRQDIVRKAALYAQFGVPEYWIVDPEAETIAVNELREGQYVHVPNRRGFARSTVVPGLKVRVADVFAMPAWMQPAAEAAE
jgi:Uma2 family endonuclease